MQLIDHPWAVCIDRAQKAGQRLAHLLMRGCHGDRPVTLVAHGLGARLAFHCLLELCRCRALGPSLSLPCPLCLCFSGQECTEELEREAAFPVAALSASVCWHHQLGCYTGGLPVCLDAPVMEWEK